MIVWPQILSSRINYFLELSFASNLNISRYVDTTEPEVPVIIEDVLKDLGELENQREETNSKLNSYLKELGLL